MELKYVLSAKKIYLKVTAVFIKSHKLLQPIPCGVNTKYANNNFFIKRSKKKTTNGYLVEIFR